MAGSKCCCMVSQCEEMHDLCLGNAIPGSFGMYLNFMCGSSCWCLPCQLPWDHGPDILGGWKISGTCILSYLAGQEVLYFACYLWLHIVLLVYGIREALKITVNTSVIQCWQNIIVIQVRCKQERCLVAPHTIIPMGYLQAQIWHFCKVDLSRNIMQWHLSLHYVCDTCFQCESKGKTAFM